MKVNINVVNIIFKLNVRNCSQLHDIVVYTLTRELFQTSGIKLWVFIKLITTRHCGHLLHLLRSSRFLQQTVHNDSSPIHSPTLWLDDINHHLIGNLLNLPAA